MITRSITKLSLGKQTSEEKTVNLSQKSVGEIQLPKKYCSKKKEKDRSLQPEAPVVNIHIHMHSPNKRTKNSFLNTTQPIFHIHVDDAKLKSTSPSTSPVRTRRYTKRVSKSIPEKSKNKYKKKNESNDECDEGSECCSPVLTSSHNKINSEVDNFKNGAKSNGSDNQSIFDINNLAVPTGNNEVIENSLSMINHIGNIIYPPYNKQKAPDIESNISSNRKFQIHCKQSLGDDNTEISNDNNLKESNRMNKSELISEHDFKSEKAVVFLNDTTERKLDEHEMCQTLKNHEMLPSGRKKIPEESPQCDIPESFSIENADNYNGIPELDRPQIDDDDNTLKIDLNSDSEVGVKKRNTGAHVVKEHHVKTGPSDKLPPTFDAMDLGCDTENSLDCLFKSNYVKDKEELTLYDSKETPVNSLKEVENTSSSIYSSVGGVNKFYTSTYSSDVMTVENDKSITSAAENLNFSEILKKFTDGKWHDKLLSRKIATTASGGDGEAGATASRVLTNSSNLPISEKHAEKNSNHISPDRYNSEANKSEKSNLNKTSEHELDDFVEVVELVKQSVSNYFSSNGSPPSINLDICDFEEKSLVASETAEESDFKVDNLQLCGKQSHEDINSMKCDDLGLSEITADEQKSSYGHASVKAKTAGQKMESEGGKFPEHEITRIIRLKSSAQSSQRNGQEDIEKMTGKSQKKIKRIKSIKKNGVSVKSPIVQKKKKTSKTKIKKLRREYSFAKKFESADCIPLEVAGSTQFAVSQVSKIKPYQEHEAISYKEKLLYGNRVKRFSSSSTFDTYKLKQKLIKSL